MAKSKYIIIKHRGVEVPVVFSELITHHEMAWVQQIISAGYCRRDDKGNWMVLGRSESLSLNARPQDAAILNALLQNGKPLVVIQCVRKADGCSDGR